MPAHLGVACQHAGLVASAVPVTPCRVCLQHVLSCLGLMLRPRLLCCMCNISKCDVQKLHRCSQETQSHALGPRSEARFDMTAVAYRLRRSWYVSCLMHQWYVKYFFTFGTDTKLAPKTNTYLKYQSHCLVNSLCFLSKSMHTAHKDSKHTCRHLQMVRSVSF